MSSTEPLDESADGSTTPDDGVDAPDTPTSIDEPDPPDGSPEPADRESAPEVEATGEPEAEPAVEDAVSAVATGSGEPADPETVTSDDVAPPDPAPESTEEAEASTGESAESESGEGEPAESEDAGEDVSEAPASPSTEPDDAAATTPLPAQPEPAPGPVDDGSDSERYNWPSPPDTEKRRILPWLDWKFSILLPLALLLVLATALWQLTTQPDLIEFTIQNGSTGETIAGAELIVGNDVYLADDQGVVTIERPDAPTDVRVSADGFIAMTGEVDDNTAKEQTVPLRPASLVGQLVDEATGEPIAGANIAVLDPAGNVMSATRTDDAGRYRLADVPDGAMVQIEAARYGSLTQPVGTEIEMSFSLTLQSVSGVVLSAAGEPVQGAVVRAGDATAVSGRDGIFALEGVTDGAEVSVTAPGYEATTGIVQDGRVPDVQLTALMVKGVYANLGLLGTPGGLEQLVEIANTTEINAIVIDIKQDTIYYDSQVQFFLDAGTVRPIYDAGEVLQLLEDNGIYAIARLVVFQDPLVAEARPELAVHDVNGDLWRNEMNVAWVSAFNEELWDANIALAVEAIGLGFDEVQYDYVRFPSDGDLTTADFGREYTAEARETAITEFVKRSHEAINDAGGLLSADLFGFVTLMDDEQYIGQRFSALEPHLDYISMMIYPSHFETGNIASAPGHPNDYPYETILESLQRSESNVPGSGEKFRPWLQDFSYGFNGLRDYTADDVRAQIDAAEDFGASGWLLWGDPFNVTVEALKPELAS